MADAQTGAITAEKCLAAELRAAALRFRQDARRVLHRGTIRALLTSAEELMALADAVEGRRTRSTYRESDVGSIAAGRGQADFCTTLRPIGAANRRSTAA